MIWAGWTQKLWYHTCGFKTAFQLFLFLAGLAGQQHILNFLATRGLQITSVGIQITP